MGICLSAEDREKRSKSQRIDRELEEDNKKLRRECKILLLGNTPTLLFNLFEILISKHDTQEAVNQAKVSVFFPCSVLETITKYILCAGTLIKQMKIIHQNGYSKDELLTFKLTIFKNIVESIQSIISAVQKFEYAFETSKDQVCLHL